MHSVNDAVNEGREEKKFFFLNESIEMRWPVNLN